ncbi:MAG: fimbrial protein, partial [Novosphingobium sp.]|nr:fimbrial protein [Novosphingobium sp.]
TLANQLGDTIGIVEAHDTKGARITSGSGARIDGAGYAVVPYLMPYRLNEVGIDPEGVSANVELKATSQQVAPRANSVVILKFETVSGQGVIIGARLTDGSAVPFGASVYDAKQAEVGLVGQDGEIFLRGIPATGTLHLRWGDAADSQCGFDYILPAHDVGDASLARLGAVCRQSSSSAQSAPHIAAMPV